MMMGDGMADSKSTTQYSKNCFRSTRRKLRHRVLSLHSSTVGILSATVFLAIPCIWAFSPSISESISSSPGLFAKRNRRSQQDGDGANWFDAVDEDASPDDVFWAEMERQRASAATETTTTNAMDDFTSRRSAMDDFTAKRGTMMPEAGKKAPNEPGPKSVEATLSEYDKHQVYDNWLDDDLIMHMMPDVEEDEEDAIPLDQQLEQWEASDGGDKAKYMASEPWDAWGSTDLNDSPSNDDTDVLSWETEDPEDKALEEEFQRRINEISIRSSRLEKARDNPKAKAFFERQPDPMEGFDRMWVSAIDNVCFKNLMGTFRNYGIQFADNFGDFMDGRPEDGFYTIEEVASAKARRVFEVTGLPCIASRTSFEIEPIPDFGTVPGAPLMNPRVSAGYRFNDIGDHVDYLTEALKTVSEPTRVTRFKTCLCYYDGAMEVFDYGVCDVDIYFCNSLRTFVPMSMAINEMLKTLELTFGLEYQKLMRGGENSDRGKLGAASIKLRDRVLKEGRVLPNDIVDVSAFMDSRVDVNLMKECAEELAEKFIQEKPNKVLTVATTGLVIAMPIAQYLQVPVVYARKERNVVMSNTFKATYSSKTVGKNRELLVAKEHLEEDDRVLVIDDFLSSGSSQEALLRIISESGATPVGIGVLLEKIYDSGRQFLSGFDIPIHSMCGIASVQDGVIRLREEEGFEDM